MASWNLRYLTQKLALGAEEMFAALQSQNALQEALARGVAAYKRSLTGVMVLTGVSMAPTLNPNASQQPDAVEKLLIRLIPRPSNRSLFTGDVIAFNNPFAPAAAQSGQPQQVMVRRIAAMEGDELISEEAGEDEVPEEYIIPDGHCWLLADNESLQPPHVIDSRALGPIPLSSIFGRVMYSMRSEHDHGPVENSEEGLAADAPVLEAELNLDTLWEEQGDEHEDEQ